MNVDTTTLLNPQNGIGNRQSEPNLNPDEIIFLVLPGPFRDLGSTLKCPFFEQFHTGTHGNNRKAD
jgi:hypothetical protein